MSILDIAEAIHLRDCEPIHSRMAGIAYPFGHGERPVHRWHVSPDIMQSLTEAAPPAHRWSNPKTSQGATKLLFGHEIEVDRAAKPGTLHLAKEGDSG